MKYYFDKRLIEYLNLDYKLYNKIQILNAIIDNKNNWNNLEGNIILNKHLLDILKYKYPKKGKVNYNILFNNVSYWKHRMDNGFKVRALKTIIESCIINNSEVYNNESVLDKGKNIMNLVI